MENIVSCVISERAAAAVAELLPDKSKGRYEKQYARFKDWCATKKVSQISEDVLLVFFAEESKIYKSSTLWSTYSMLKAMLLIKEDINIANYLKLKSYLKRKSVGYEAKKSRVFSRNEVMEFLKNAPDRDFLFLKVVLIFGLSGACRCDELVKMTLDDIQEKEDSLIVKIPDSKTHKPRRFVILDDSSEPGNIAFYRKYLSLRPPQTPHRRLFLSYRRGKCSVQAVGIHTFGKAPAKIAGFLQLPNATEYTGHSLRRTSATLLMDAGGKIEDLKRHGGWSSTGVAEGYVAESLENKRQIAKKIQQCVSAGKNASGATSEIPSTSACDDSDAVNGISDNINIISADENRHIPAINLPNGQNITVNINVNINKN